MNNRDQQLQAARPLIPTITEMAVTTAAELFQNKTLRPILKLQNDLLLHIFKQYNVQRKNVFANLSQEKRMEYIEHSIRKDLKFRNLLIGCVVGQFTLEEYQTYVSDESELRKRMINMLVERIKGQGDAGR